MGYGEGFRSEIQTYKRKGKSKKVELKTIDENEKRENFFKQNYEREQRQRNRKIIIQDNFEKYLAVHYKDKNINEALSMFLRKKSYHIAKSLVEPTLLVQSQLITNQNEIARLMNNAIKVHNRRVEEVMNKQNEGATIEKKTSIEDDGR